MRIIWSTFLFQKLISFFFATLAILKSPAVMLKELDCNTISFSMDNKIWHQSYKNTNILCICKLSIKLLYNTLCINWRCVSCLNRVGCQDSQAHHHVWLWSDCMQPGCQGCVVLQNQRHWIFCALEQDQYSTLSPVMEHCMWVANYNLVSQPNAECVTIWGLNVWTLF